MRKDLLIVAGLSAIIASAETSAQTAYNELCGGNL